MRISINDFIKDPELLSDDYYGFYDWFCESHKLGRRAKAMVPKLKWLVKEGIVDGDANYVWFKNNCPMAGSLYDDMRISSLSNTEQFMGGFCPTSGHYVENKCSVWYFENHNTDRQLKQYDFLNWAAFKKEVKTNPQFKTELIYGFKGLL